MGTGASIGLVAALLAGCAAVAGCQSTQATSAEREAAGAKLLKAEKGLKITEVSSDVKVLGTTLLEDDNGAAVVVELKNMSNTGFANVPISIDVRDAKGKSVFKNNTPGILPALYSVPVIGPGETVDWVNDQILATGDPDSVKVEVGVSDQELPPQLPEISVGEAELAKDSFSGIEADGEISLESGPDQKDVTLFAVVRDGDEVVAAGRGGVKRLLIDAKHPSHYTIFFIGDPQGGEITVTAPPTVLE